jgi:hypothetical protein
MEVDRGDEYSNDLQVCEMRKDETGFGNRSCSDLLRAEDAKVQLAGLAAQIQGRQAGSAKSAARFFIWPTQSLVSAFRRGGACSVDFSPHELTPREPYLQAELKIS